MALFALVGRVLGSIGGVAGRAAGGMPGDATMLAALRAASIEFLVGALGGALYGMLWSRLRLEGRRRRLVAGAIAGAGAMLPLAGWLLVAGTRRADGALPILLAPLAPLAGAICGALLALVAGEHGP